jgi:hypothetical protein
MPNATGRRVDGGESAENHRTPQHFAAKAMYQLFRWRRNRLGIARAHALFSNRFSIVTPHFLLLGALCAHRMAPLAEVAF